MMLLPANMKQVNRGLKNLVNSTYMHCKYPENFFDLKQQILIKFRLCLIVSNFVGFLGFKYYPFC